MATLDLININKIYPNGVQAVFDFNLHIDNEEFIIFVGPSGCGKSTTLRMIAGLEDISSGDFYINDVRMNNVSPKDRGIAMVFQSYALYPHMTVYDNIAFGLQLRRVPKEVIDAEVKEAARMLDLERFLKRYPRQLSGGQCQRVALGRAIVRKADVFLLDEPLSNLDAKLRVTMRSEITQIHKSVGSTSIYVTHDQTEAMTMADRIVVMKDGYIQQIGTPYDLYFHPANTFVAGFIGEPPMNLISTRIENGKALVGEETLELDKVMDAELLKEYEGKEIVFGFRPEAIAGGAREDAYVFGSNVELTELLGDNTNVYADMGEDKAILKVDPREAPKMDESYTFSVPYTAVYVFDKETGKTIRG